VPAGIGPVAATPIVEDVVETESPPPKLHYHRDGFVSINATGRLPRRAIQARSFSDLGHTHCFSLYVVEPKAFRSGQPRASDSVVRVEGELGTVKVVVRLGLASNLKEPHASHPENPRGLDIEQEDGTVLATLIARLSAGSESIYAWLELHPNPVDFKPETPDLPWVGLYAYDNREPIATPDRPGELLGVWAEGAGG
jgi:hypothetical protein